MEAIDRAVAAIRSRGELWTRHKAVLDAAKGLDHDFPDFEKGDPVAQLWSVHAEIRTIGVGVSPELLRDWRLVGRFLDEIFRQAEEERSHGDAHDAPP